MNDSSQDLYLDGKYFSNNRTYHIEDSAFKWKNFRRCLERYKDSLPTLGSFLSVVEIGCGGGQILQSAKDSGALPAARFSGWDISPDAISLAKRLSPDIDFYCGDIFSSGKSHCDLVICADVFEHVENPLSFLRDLRRIGRHFLFNIPLEMNLLTLLRQRYIFQSSYDSVGHIHFYAKGSALLLLRLSGYDVLGCVYAKNRLAHLTRNNITLRRMLATFPQFVIDKISEDLSCELFGDSLIVLAK